MFVRADNPLNQLNPQSNSFFSFLRRHIKLFAMLHYTHTSSVLNMYDDYLSTLSACVLLPVSCVVRPAAPWPIIAGDDDICTVDSFQSNQSWPAV